MAKIREMDEKWSHGSFSQDRRQMRNCAGQLFTWLLISRCFGNHRAFSQDLDNTVIKPFLCGLCGEQGCHGAEVKLTQVCLGMTDKRRLLWEVLWILPEKTAWRMDDIPNSGDQLRANDQES